MVLGMNEQHVNVNMITRCLLSQKARLAPVCKQPFFLGFFNKFAGLYKIIVSRISERFKS